MAGAAFLDGREAPLVGFGALNLVRRVAVGTDRRRGVVGSQRLRVHALGEDGLDAFVARRARGGHPRAVHPAGGVGLRLDVVRAMARRAVGRDEQPALGDAAAVHAVFVVVGHLARRAGEVLAAVTLGAGLRQVERVRARCGIGGGQDVVRAVAVRAMRTVAVGRAASARRVMRARLDHLHGVLMARRARDPLQLLGVRPVGDLGQIRVTVDAGKRVNRLAVNLRRYGNGTASRTRRRLIAVTTEAIVRGGSLGRLGRAGNRRGEQTGDEQQDEPHGVSAGEGRRADKSAGCRPQRGPDRRRPAARRGGNDRSHRRDATSSSG